METKITQNYNFKSKNTNLSFTLAEDEKEEFVLLLEKAIEVVKQSIISK